MEVAYQREVHEERRHSSPNKRALMNQLSMSQQFAVNSLSQYGYSLAFIRNENCSNYVVMKNGDTFAVVNIQGDIETSPNISVRS